MVTFMTTFLGKFGPKDYNCQFKLKIWYLDKFKSAEVNGGIHFFCFRLETSFLSKFSSKSQNYQTKLKFGG